MKTINRNIKKVFSLSLMFFFFCSITFSQSIEEGLKQIDYQQYKKAKETFLLALKQNPTSARTMFYVGETYFILGNTDSADYYFSKGIQTDYNDAYNYVGVGKIALLKNNKETAGKNFTKAISINKTKDAYVYVLLAEAYIKIKEFDQALMYLGKAKDINKTIGEIFIKYADIFLAQNKAGDALTMLERYTDINKNFAKSYFYIGYINSLALQYIVAKKAFQNVIAIDSNFVPVWKELGELENMARKYNLASDAYKKYISIANYTFDDKVRYAQIIFLNKEYDLAKKEIDNIFKIDSSNIILKRLLAYSLYETGDYQKGLNYINIFFKLVDPSKILTSDYEYKGRLLLKNGQDSLGLESIDKIIKMDSSNYEIYAEIAKDFDKQKKFKYSIITYNKLIEKRPSPVASDYYQLGKAYYFTANDTSLDSNAVKAMYIKADTLFGKVIELNNKYYAGFLWKARISSLLDPTGNKGLAKPLYEKMIEIAEPNKDKYKKELIEAYIYLGNYFMYIKEDKAGSKVYWEKIKELDTTNKTAEDMLKKIGVGAPNQKK